MIRIFIVSILLLCASFARAELNLSSGPFAYTTSQKSLARVFNELSLGLSTPVDASRVARADRLVEGSWESTSIAEFLRDFSAELDLQWLILDGSLILFEQSGQATRVFRSEDPQQAARETEAFVSGFGNPRAFNVDVLPDGVKLVAPDWFLESFAEQLELTFSQTASFEQADASSAVQRLRRLQREIELLSQGRVALMMFPLKHAWVDDKTFSVGGNETEIPGVASLFAQLTGAVPVDVASTSGVANGGLSDEHQLNEQKLQQLQQERAAFRPTIASDIRTNTLIVRDFEERRAEYALLIEALDQPTDLIQLEAYIVDVNRSKLRELGIGFQNRDGSIRGTFGTDSVAANTANLVLDSVRGSQLLANIRLLETQGDSQIMSVPSVLAVNNNEAVFSSRETFYVSVAAQEDAKLIPVTAETRLRVTPMVTDNDTQSDIRMLINVQDSSIDGVEGFAASKLPRTVEYQVSTQAVVADGETLLIGGQVIDRNVSSNSSVPGLSNIPLLGRVFRSSTKDSRQFLRLFLIKPTILNR